MLNTVGSVLSVIAMIAIGFILTRRSWFDANAGPLISKLVITVSLPAYMVSNLMGGYDRARLVSMLPGLPVPFLSMGTGYLLAILIAALLNVPKGRRGTFASMFSLSNTIFIGLPVNTILFGEASVPYVLLFYMANTLLFWTVSAYGIARDGSILAGKPAPVIISMDALKRILATVHKSACIGYPHHARCKTTRNDALFFQDAGRNDYPAVHDFYWHRDCRR